MSVTAADVLAEIDRQCAGLRVALTDPMPGEAEYYLDVSLRTLDYLRARLRSQRFADDVATVRGRR